MEKFAKDHEAWSRENILNEEKIKHLELEKHNANINFNLTNKNLAYLKKNELVLLKKEPKLTHYYKPSKKLQNYQHAASGMMGFGSISWNKSFRPSVVNTRQKALRLMFVNFHNNVCYERILLISFHVVFYFPPPTS